MDSVIFVSVVIVALTQMVKMALPQQVVGWITVLIALVTGVLVAIFAPALGLAHMSIADGVVSALGAIGISTAAGKASGGVAGDGVKPV